MVKGEVGGPHEIVVRTWVEPCDCPQGSVYQRRTRSQWVDELFESGDPPMSTGLLSWVRGQTEADLDIDAHNRAAWQALKSRADGTYSGTRPILVVQGMFGTGKTHLLGVAAQIWIQRDVHVRYVNWSSFLRDLKAGFRDHTSDLTLRNLAAAPAAIIDDLGSEALARAQAGSPEETVQSWAQDQLYHVVNTFYAEGKPLIVATNLAIGTPEDALRGNPNTLYGRYQSRTADRLDGEKAESVTVTGTSRRRAARKVVPS